MTSRLIVFNADVIVLAVADVGLVVVAVVVIVVVGGGGAVVADSLQHC